MSNHVDSASTCRVLALYASYQFHSLTPFINLITTQQLFITPTITPTLTYSNPQPHFLSHTRIFTNTMSAQPHLNGAYYGPSIPPPDQPRRKSYRAGRSGGGGCNPFTWCCCCLFNCALSLVLQIIIGILVIAGIAILIFWLIFRPNVPKFHVTDATLTQFEYTNNTLRYNLALNMTFRNPNRRIGIYYDKIDARAYYHGERFAATEIPRFYLGHKKENFVSPQFVGQQLVVLGNRDSNRYNSETGAGVYEIDVKLKLRLRFKVGVAKTARFTPEIECDLRIPLDSNGRSSGSFERKKCDFDW